MDGPDRTCVPEQDELKKRAAEQAVEFVRSGMVVGLGTGSTMRHALDRIGELLREGKLRGIVGLPTSERTLAHAQRVGIPLADLEEYPECDLAIDGADEVDPDFNLVKGRGGALLREKMVATVAKQFIVIVDQTKLVERLGTRGPVPVEVVKFAWKSTARSLERLGCEARLRMAEGKPYFTDNQNYILDCYFQSPLEKPRETAISIKTICGVVEHGLFLDMASMVVVASSDGVSISKATRPGRHGNTTDQEM